MTRYLEIQHESGFVFMCDAAHWIDDGHGGVAVSLGELTDEELAEHHRRHDRHNAEVAAKGAKR